MAQRIDLQINGYGGVDYNTNDLTAEALHASCEAIRRDGVSQILATIVTDAVPTICRRLANIVAFRERDPLLREMIVGFHVEGPFLNSQKGYAGAHAPTAMVPATVDEAKKMFDACAGMLRILTLAPENDANLATTAWLVKQGVTVAAGHTNAPFDTLKAAADAGLSMFTHLGNGCPMEMHRHDNIIQRVLALSDRIHPGLIADGVHLPLFVLKNFIKLIGVENCFVVTDAISAAGKGPGLYRLGQWEIRVGEDLAVRSPDGTHFVGSAVTMKREMELLASIGLSQAEIVDLTDRNPRRFIGL